MQLRFSQEFDLLGLGKAAVGVVEFLREEEGFDEGLYSGCGVGDGGDVGETWKEVDGGC